MATKVIDNNDLPAVIANAKGEEYKVNRKEITENSQKNKIHDTKEGIKNFNDWFEGSHAVDKKGNPLVLYHGSPNVSFLKNDASFKSQFEKFGMGKETGAHWFTPDIKTAKTYTDTRKLFNQEEANPGIIPAYLSLKNPLVVDGQGNDWMNAQQNGMTSTVINKALENGHDGLIIKNVIDPYNLPETKKKAKPTDTYMVFNSNQIKHINNNGDFNKKESNIYK